ncbi:hypothetical protein CspeluHIS016_0109640 [Cutaneotrichosporon spelunceum]|uniref:Transferase n=1 Tax=Cutaneotrichosporon spelunceum TaxID=1672016 RepID=A0AAD3TPN4_9TREE|nr:hypothetical protein CspeluHIS016_0109640 [Cutaneotrichosporon spelunceum]
MAQLRQTSQHPLHPRPCRSGLTPVSITDSALAELTPTAAAWFFSAPVSGTYDPSLLARALEATLSIYPQLSGKLSLSPNESKAYPPHTQRYGRVWVRWGAYTPGLLLTQAAYDGPLHPTLPTLASVMPDTRSLVRLRPCALGPARPGPATVAQITTFACGGVALALAVQHALLDAHALAYVLRDWGAIHASMVCGAPPPEITRSYAPMDLDALANPDSPHAGLEALSATVPQLRLDFWAYDPASAADQGPGWFTRPRAPPPEVDGADEAAGRPRGPRAPFETWDPAAPVGQAVLDLSAADVARLAAPGASALDSVLGAVWAAVVRARPTAPHQTVWMHGCVGLRGRLGLPDDFQGAPLINVSAGLAASDLLAERGVGARTVRASINTVTKESAEAVLHHMAHALDPAREWNVFVGSQNILSTSWLGIGAYEVDFGFGTPERMLPYLPPVDGIVVVAEAKVANRQHGARGGVSLLLILREDVLARVLADPQLVGEK